MKKKFVEIDADTFAAIEKIAQETGFESVEKLLKQFALDFSSGCVVSPYWIFKNAIR